MIYLMRYVLSTMGVSKESISKFLICWLIPCLHPSWKVTRSGNSQSLTRGEDNMDPCENKWSNQHLIDVSQILMWTTNKAKFQAELTTPRASKIATVVLLPVGTYSNLAKRTLIGSLRPAVLVMISARIACFGINTNIKSRSHVSDIDIAWCCAGFFSYFLIYKTLWIETTDMDELGWISDRSSVQTKSLQHAFSTAVLGKVNWSSCRWFSRQTDRPAKKEILSWEAGRWQHPSSATAAAFAHSASNMSFTTTTALRRVGRYWSV